MNISTKAYSLLIAYFILVISLINLWVQLSDKYVNFALILCSILSVILFIIFITNHIISNNLNSKKLTFTDIFNEFSQLEDEFEKRQQELYKKYKKTIRLGNMYIIFINLSLILIALLSSYLLVKVSPFFIILLILSFSLECVQIYLLGNLSQKPTFKNYLFYDPKYKKLQEIVYNSIELSGLKKTKKIHIQIEQESNFLVLRTKRKHYIALGLLSLMTLKEDEITAILLHELAHIINGDTILNERRTKYNQLWEKIRTNKIIRGFYRLFGAYILKTSEMYFAPLSKLIEKKADRFVVEKGYGEQYDIANIKAAYHEYYAKSTFKERKFSKDYETIIHYYNDMFIKTYELNKDKWNRYLYSEIEEKLLSHPTAINRINNKENLNKEIDLLVDESLKDELDSLCKTFESYYYQKDICLKAKEHMEFCDSILNEDFYGNPIPYDYRFSRYSDNNQLEELFELSKEALSLCPQHPLYLYYYGIALLEKEDNSGLEYLKKAVDIRRQYSEFVVGIILNYCILNNLKEEYDYYNSWKDKHYNDLISVNKGYQLKKIRYKKYNLTEEQIKGVKEILRKSKVYECRIKTICFADNVETVNVQFSFNLVYESKEHYLTNSFLFESILNIFPDCVFSFEYINPKKKDKNDSIIHLND